MPWASLALVLLKLANSIMSIIDKEKMLAAGEARNFMRTVREIETEQQKVRTAILTLYRDPAWQQRLRELGDRDA